MFHNKSLYHLRIVNMSDKRKRVDDDEDENSSSPEIKPTKKTKKATSSEDEDKDTIDLTDDSIPLNQAACSKSHLAKPVKWSTKKLLKDVTNIQTFNQSYIQRRPMVKAKLPSHGNYVDPYSKENKTLSRPIFVTSIAGRI